MHLIFVLMSIQAAYFLLYNPNMGADIKDMFSLGNYTNITSNSTYYINVENYSNNFTTAPLGGYSSQSFWESALDFTSGGAGTVIIKFLIILAVTMWGLSLFYRSELTLLTPLFILLLGIGLLPCMSLYYMVTSDVGIYVCNINDGGTVQSCLLSSTVGLFTAGILFIMWIMSCVEFWTARSTG
jgi:hypothetical protein